MSGKFSWTINWNINVVALIVVIIGAIVGVFGFIFLHEKDSNEARILMKTALEEAYTETANHIKGAYELSSKDIVDKMVAIIDSLEIKMQRADKNLKGVITSKGKDNITDGITYLQQLSAQVHDTSKHKKRTLYALYKVYGDDKEILTTECKRIKHAIKLNLLKVK